MEKACPGLEVAEDMSVPCDDGKSTGDSKEWIDKKCPIDTDMCGLYEDDTQICAKECSDVEESGCKLNPFPSGVDVYKGCGSGKPCEPPKEGDVEPFHYAIPLDYYGELWKLHDNERGLKEFPIRDRRTFAEYVQEGDGG